MQHSDSHPNDPSSTGDDLAHTVLRGCGQPALFCEADGQRDSLAIVIRDTAHGPACVTVCPGCATARPHPLTASGAKQFALDHARHVTQEKDRQAGST